MGLQKTLVYEKDNQEHNYYINLGKFNFDNQLNLVISADCFLDKTISDALKEDYTINQSNGTLLLNGVYNTRSKKVGERTVVINRYLVQDDPQNPGTKIRVENPRHRAYANAIGAMIFEDLKSAYEDLSDATDV